MHIPKCAGTSVRTPLERLDERDGFYANRVDTHPSLGVLDYVHIPLFTLEKHFPEDYKRLEQYWSLAVLRDPFYRFPSSLSQRLKKYGKGPIQRLRAAEIKSEIDNVIGFLSAQPKTNFLLPAEYVHFQQQVDYVRLNNVRVIDTLYTVNQVDRLLQDVNARASDYLSRSGCGGTTVWANRTVTYRNDLVRRVVEEARPLTRWIPNGRLFGALKQTCREIVYVHRDRRLASIFGSDYVKEFIEDYYKEDSALFKEIGAYADQDRGGAR